MARTQLTLPFGPVRNSELLSNHWLEKRLPLEPEWDELRKEAQTALDTLAALWKKQSPHAPSLSEAQLEYQII